MNIIHHFFSTIYMQLLTWWNSLPIWYNNTGSVALCCIAKCENDYIQEFVDYYIKLGIDKIFIYDNNDADGERLDQVLSYYISSGYCEVINYRGKKVCQLDAYQDCYNKHNKYFDWIAFFDCDEFLHLNTAKNIKMFLAQSMFKHFQIVHVNWMVFGDNDLVKNDGRKLSERFISPHLPFNFTYRYDDIPENNHIKSIVRGNLKNLRWIHTPHDPIVDYYRCCNASGKECDPNSAFCKYDYSEAYLKHYYTKTIEKRRKKF